MKSPHVKLIQDLKSLRRKRGLSQFELARRIGRNQARVSELESTKFDPRLSTLLAVFDALDAELIAIPRENANEVRQLVRSPNIGAASPTRDVFDELFVTSENEDRPKQVDDKNHARKR